MAENYTKLNTTRLTLNMYINVVMIFNLAQLSEKMNFFFSQNIKIRKRLQNVDNHIIYKTRCSESTVPEQEEGVYLLWRGTSVFAVSYVGPPSFCCLLQRARGTDQEILSSNRSSRNS